MEKWEYRVVRKVYTWTRALWFIDILKCVIPFNRMLTRVLSNSLWVHAVGCACIRYLRMWVESIKCCNEGIFLNTIVNIEDWMDQENYRI